MSDIDEEENKSENGIFKNTKDMDPKLEKIIKILCVIVGGIFVVIFVIFLATQLGRFGGGLGVDDKTDDSSSTEEQMTTTEEEKETVIMPNLVEKSWEEAIEILEKNKLEYDIVEEISNDVEAGYVIRQSIKRGDEIETGTKVTVVVSIGKDSIDVPSVAGKPESEAKQIITNSDGDFKVSTKEEYSDTVPEGHVIRQEPETKAEHGSTITLIISKGKEPAKQAAVPSLENRTESEAEAALKDAGLSIGKIREVNHNQVPKGKVISQSVAAGTTVSVGTKVDIVVSAGPAFNGNEGDNGNENDNSADGTTEENQNGE